MHYPQTLINMFAQSIVLHQRETLARETSAETRFRENAIHLIFNPLGHSQFCGLQLCHTPRSSNRYSTLKINRALSPRCTPLPSSLLFCRVEACSTPLSKRLNTHQTHQGSEARAGEGSQCRPSTSEQKRAGGANTCDVHCRM